MKLEVFSSWITLYCAPALGLLGAGIAAIGVFYTENGVTLFGALVAALSSLISTVKQSELGEKLQEANEKLIRQAEEISAIVTGGDSFAYFTLSPSSANQALLTVIHQGKYPLYEVTADMVDLSFPLLPVFPQPGRTQISIGIMPASSAKPIRSFQLPSDRETQGYNIFFCARNGFWHQLLRCRKVNSGWAFATKVVGGSLTKPKMLLEEVAPNYPRNTDGQVDWA